MSADSEKNQENQGSTEAAKALPMASVEGPSTTASLTPEATPASTPVTNSVSTNASVPTNGYVPTKASVPTNGPVSITGAFDQTGNSLVKTLFQPLQVLLVLTVATGLIYPLAVTGLAQSLFPFQANGSLIKDAKTGVTLGSALLGQEFKADIYMHSRPSATSPYPYNAANSGGSNLGPTNRTLIKQMQDRTAVLLNESGTTEKVPVDLVTASGSGLDPDISVAAADYQIPRIARARKLSVDKVRGIVARFTEKRQFKILGNPRVNVFKVNLALDGKLP